MVSHLSNSIFALFLVLLLLPHEKARAEQPDTLFIEGAQETPLTGFVRFCENYPTQCKPTVGKYTYLAIADIMDTLRDVQAKVNKRITYEREPEGEDQWLIYFETAKGDCDDYVMTYRAELLKLGFPSWALRVTYINTDRHDKATGKMIIDAHVVLTVVASDGSHIVIDQYAMATWDKLMAMYPHYKPDMWQSAHDPKIWVSIKPHNETIAVKTH